MQKQNIHTQSNTLIPVQNIRNQTEFELLISALSEGWKIVETVRLDALMDSKKSSYYLTIFHPQWLLSYELVIERDEKVDQLLSNQDVIVVNRHQNSYF